MSRRWTPVIHLAGVSASYTRDRTVSNAYKEQLDAVVLVKKYLEGHVSNAYKPRNQYERDGVIGSRQIAQFLSKEGNVCKERLQTSKYRLHSGLGAEVGVRSAYTYDRTVSVAYSNRCPVVGHLSFQANCPTAGQLVKICIYFCTHIFFRHYIH